jgi:leader peptidase (prepilin peptidase)/N-methyltransferase
MSAGGLAPAAVLAVLAVFGAVIGSFLNVVIHRLPRGLSLVRPRSRCPQCGCSIAPYDNIPLLSYLILRGRCRGCGVRIPSRYPLVELLTAALFVSCGLLFDEPAALGLALVFTAAMIAVVFIDLEHMIIPNSITLPGVIVGLAAALLGVSIEPVRALAGIVVGGGGLYAVAFGYRVLTGRDGLGGGDVKLLAMVGAFLGPAGAFLTILLGSLAGSIFALAWVGLGRAGRRSELPFGTFLAPGAVVVLFYGSRIVELYWGLVSR